MESNSDAFTRIIFVATYSYYFVSLVETREYLKNKQPRGSCHCIFGVDLVRLYISYMDSSSSHDEKPFYHLSFLAFNYRHVTSASLYYCYGMADVIDSASSYSPLHFIQII